MRPKYLDNRRAAPLPKPIHTEAHSAVIRTHSDVIQKCGTHSSNIRTHSAVIQTHFLVIPSLEQNAVKSLKGYEAFMWMKFDVIFVTQKILKIFKVFYHS